MSREPVVVLSLDRDLARANCRPVYGSANPELIDNAFFDIMIRTRETAYRARQWLGIETDFAHHKATAASARSRVGAAGPVFCFRRFGRTVTQLADGRVIHVGGEHEDWYDPDFCIYNDVVVETSDGDYDIHLYPVDVFPPTDFHTATLVGERIYLIGGLGYQDHRQEGVTLVHVLDTQSLSITPFETFGDNPGWISRHSAEVDNHGGSIRLAGGQVLVGGKLRPNEQIYRLDLTTGIWSRERGSRGQSDV